VTALTIEVVTPVAGERVLNTGASKDCETENEDTDLSSTIETGRQDVIVLHVPIGVVSTDPELGNEGNHEVDHD